MKLLIVESPGKIKKLRSILGGQWEVAASVGHVRDLPDGAMGVEPPNFVPQYEPTKRGGETLSKLGALVKKVDEVYLATDPDREGEAIAWHLQDALSLKNPKRVTYTSITEKDVLDGIAKCKTIDMDLVKAQESRRVIDRLCGYMVSPALNGIFGENFSAGRVQSPALRLVVERERAIRTFISTIHYGVSLTFEAVEGIQDGWKATWNTKSFLEDGQEYILDKGLAEKVATLRTLTVTTFEESDKKSAPPAPFTTSSLQQAASNALKLSPKKTMELAQKLYEQGHITYMRTDSPNLSAEAVQEIRAFCDSQGWPLVGKPRTWKSKTGAQEAHEAIRPTHVDLVEITLEAKDNALLPMAQALYMLIRLRVLASQLEDAVFSVRKIALEGSLDGKSVLFEATGRTLVSKGWKVLFEKDDALADEEDTEEVNAIPVLKEGNLVTALSANIYTKKTQPPTRFTQAALVRELEKKGIGRPATYAAILDNIITQKGYIKEEKQKLFATSLGEKLIDAMSGYFSFLDLEFTKGMETRLDTVADGKSDYTSLVAETYALLTQEITKIKQEKATPCPKCASVNFRHMVRRGEKSYNFFVCPDCGIKCNNVDGRPVEQTGSVLTDFLCEKCDSKLYHRKGPRKDGSGEYDFFACSDDTCKTSYNNVDGVPTAKKPKGKLTEYKCKKCKKPLYEMPTKKGGVWFPCSGFPKCTEKYWPDNNGKPQF